MLYIMNMIIAHVFWAFLAVSLYYSFPPNMFGPSEPNIFWEHSVFLFLTFVIILRARTYAILIGSLVVVWAGPAINALYQLGFIGFMGLFIAIGVFYFLPVPKDQENT